MSLTQMVGAYSQTQTRSESENSQSIAAFCAKAVLGSLFVALCSHIAFPVPFTPVPFTMQPFAVLLVGMLFGPWVGFSALALYLAEGAAGLPVFTPMGLPGLARLVGPTGGYLFSYPLAAAVAGIPFALRRVSFNACLLAAMAAMLVVYTCGALWFSISLRVPAGLALSQTVIPFALSDLLKACATAGIASALLRARKHA